MSTSLDQQGSALGYREDPLSSIEAVADRLVALVEEFEPPMREGQVPRGFAQCLAQLRQTAERLADR